MRLPGYWNIIRKRLWIILLLVAVVSSATAYVASQQMVLYRTSAALFINPEQTVPLLESAPDVHLTYSGKRAGAVEVLANTYAELMTTHSFIQQVVRELDTDISAQEVRRSLTSHYLPDTHIFRISATHPDPAVAQQLARTAASVLIKREVVRQQEQRDQIATMVPAEGGELLNTERVLRDEIEVYTSQIEQIEAQIAELEAQPATQQRDAALQELRERLRNWHYARIDLLNRLEEVRSNSTHPFDTLVLVDDPPLPTTPLSHHTGRWTAAAALVTLALGVVLAFLRDYFDYTIKDPDTLDMVYNMPVQGVFGTIDPADAPHQNINLVALSDPPSAAAEAFRSLRTGVEVAALNRPVRSVLVTSAGAGEGKTFVAANLAVSMALNHRRVVLVDANLRKPALHDIFDLPRGPGLTNLIVNPKSNIADVLSTTAIPNLHVLPCGTIPPNPAELLGSSQAACVIKQLQEHADIVIYDAPPVVGITDASLLAQRMDGVLQVVLAGGTRMNLVLRCRTMLYQVGAHILGPVLNRADLAGLGYAEPYRTYTSYRRDGQQRRRMLLRRILPQRNSTRDEEYTPELASVTDPDDPDPTPHSSSVSAMGIAGVAGTND